MFLLYVFLVSQNCKYRLKKFLQNYLLTKHLFFMIIYLFILSSAQTAGTHQFTFTLYPKEAY